MWKEKEEIPLIKVTGLVTRLRLAFSELAKLMIVITCLPHSLNEYGYVLKELH